MSDKLQFVARKKALNKVRLKIAFAPLPEGGEFINSELPKPYCG